MNKGLKKGLKITGVTVAVILVFMLVLPFMFKDKVIIIVKKEANEMLNAKLDFESLDISLFSHFPSASIELNGLTLSGIDDFENDTLVSAESIDVAVNVMSLFSDKGFDVNYVVLDKPSIKAVKLADGRVNWDIMKPDTVDVEEEKTVEVEGESSFRLKLKNFKIADATIVYVDDSTNMQFYTDKLNLKLSGDMSADMTDIDSKLSCKDIYFAMGGISYLKQAEAGAKLTVSADLKNNKFILKENTLSLNAIVLNLDGWVALLDDGAMDMDLKINTSEINFKEILSLIPAIYQNNFDKLRTTGNMSLTAFAKGRMAGENMPQFGLTLGVKDATLNYEGMPASVDGINIGASVSNPGGSLDKTIIDLSEFRLSMAGNPFKAALYASTPISDLNFKATADGTVHLGKIKDIYPLGDSITLSGIVTADLQFAGRMSDIEKENYQNIRGEGTLTVADMDLTMKGLPAVAVKKAQASVSAKAMSLSQLDVKVGKSDIQAHGSLSNYLAYVLKNETIKGSLTVTSLLLDLNELMGDSEPSGEETVEADTTTLSVIEVPKNIDMTLSADFKKILFQKMELDNVTGKLIVADGAVRMTPLSLNAFGGAMVANGIYSTAESVVRPMVNFDLDIQKASFEKTFEQLDMIQKIVPIFAKTGGTYSVKVDLKSALDSQMSPDLSSLTADGVIQSNDIQLQNIEVFSQLATLLKNDKLKNIEAKDLKISFTIKDGKVKTSPFDMKLGNITMNLSGVTGLDQTIDYRAKINIPGAGALSNVSATIGGTFSKPSIKLNTDEVNVAAPAKKRPWLAGAEVVAEDLLFHVLTRYLIKEDYAQISWSSIKNNFKTGLLWDNDKFETNLFSHPYQGNLYYSSARSNGLNFWESAPYALLGSSIWEWFMETQPASINDIMSTTFGGMALGETTYRLSSLVLNGQARGWERASHELVAAFLNPVRAVNRLMTGEAWRIGPRYVDKEATIPFHFRFEAGYRMLDNIREGKNRSIHVGCMDFSLIYNDPFEIEGNVPFEHFTARMLFNMFAHQPIIGDVNICASIWGREHDYKNGNELFAGIFQNYSYYNSGRMDNESNEVPFRISETVSYGPGVLYRMKLHENNTLALNGFVSGVALGGALCDYYQFHDRDYNMGSGYSIRLNGLFTLQRRFGIYLGFENYHIFTWKGYEHKDYENMNPHYLDAQGAVGDARLQMMNLRGSFAISPKVGISAETAWCRRKSHYKYFPDVLSDTFEFRLMFSYHI